MPNSTRPTGNFERGRPDLGGDERPVAPRFGVPPPRPLRPHPVRPAAGCRRTRRDSAPPMPGQTTGGPGHPVRHGWRVIVVSNTSPILNLAVIGRTGLLQELFPTLLVPPEVVSEIRRDFPLWPGARLCAQRQPQQGGSESGSQRLHACGNDELAAAGAWHTAALRSARIVGNQAASRHPATLRVLPASSLHGSKAAAKPACRSGAQR